MRAIEISQSIERGGDGHVQTLEALPGSILDIGQNENADQVGIPVTEIPDITIPVITGVSINYSQGLMVFNASEYGFYTKHRIDSTKLRLRQLENDTRPEDIFLSDPKFVAA